MKICTPGQPVRMLLAPVLTVLMGLILLFSPDTASALVGRLIAWCCILAAAALGAGALFGIPAQRNNRILWAVICFAAGVWMLMHPLAIAKFLGRVLGIALMIRGAQSAAVNIRYQGRRLVISRALAISVVILVVGAVLVILPMVASRLVLKLAGIVLICMGVAQGWDNLRGRERLDEGDDPNIIDVEKL